MIPDSTESTSESLGRHRRRRSLQRTRPERRAFTIIELVVVLLVISIFAAAATPTFFRSLQNHRLESAARRVKQDLQHLRNTARDTSQSQTITFSGTAGYTMSANVESLDDSGLYVVDLTEPPYELDGMLLNFSGASTISFDGYGTASHTGTIVLTLGGDDITIQLDGVTGQSTIVDGQADAD